MVLLHLLAVEDGRLPGRVEPIRALQGRQGIDHRQDLFRLALVPLRQVLAVGTRIREDPLLVELLADLQDTGGG